MAAHAADLVRTDAAAQWHEDHIVISSRLQITAAPATTPVPSRLLQTPQTLNAATLFAVNSAQLKDTAVLRPLMQSLVSLPRGHVVIKGYTDATGSVQSNLVLSQKRAQAVLTALRQIAPQHQYEAAGYGETNPVASNSTRDGRANNRRVTVEVHRAI